MSTAFAYYNENDLKIAAWLRALIAAGHIADGVVDERNIHDVQTDDLTGFTQCHFFAGIGGWSYALRLAGWPDDRPVWTGSCPCQPFSSAGKQKGFADDRHLWPVWFPLIRECRPSVVFGEQVASKAGLAWFDAVHADLEGQNYAVGAADLCAAGIGAPHIRQRLFWVADSKCGTAERWRHNMGVSALDVEESTSERERLRADPWTGCDSCRDNKPQDETVGGGMADTNETRRRTRSGSDTERTNRGIAGRATDTSGYSSLVGKSDSERETSLRRLSEGTIPECLGSVWSAADWLYCRDGKYRPVESGTFPLAHGVPARVGRLRGYGNAIVPQVAATFIEAYMQTQTDVSL